MDLDDKRVAVCEVAFRLKVATELLKDAAGVALGPYRSNDPETMKLLNRQRDLFLRFAEVAAIPAEPFTGSRS
jgi:hypothetical protein